MILYDPADHYWIIGGDGTQLYASARRIMVEASDELYVAWLVDHKPTAIGSMDELKDVLRAANVAPYRTVTQRQARLALLENGLLDQVDAAVAAAGGATAVSWNFATELYEGDSMVAQLATTLGLTDTQVFALFTRAAEIL